MERVGVGVGPSAPHGLNFAWLLRLRWAAIAAQAVTVAIVHRVMHVPLPLAPLFALVGVEAATNLAAMAHARAGRPVGEGHVAAIMVVDVIILSGLLYFSGGPFNPFSFLYLVYIALAAVVLRPRWTWGLVVLSLLCSAVLFVDHRALELPAKTHDEHMRWHLWGMWVAFGVAAAFIVYFLMRVLRSLGAREAELGEARARADRQERLASLATLAGGAAHELATPLATIATVARELERQLAGAGAGADVLDDVRLVRSQVDRCRAILDQMSAHAGESAGEGLASLSAGELVAAAIVDLGGEPTVRIELDGSTDGQRFALPPRALAQAVRVLVSNARDASPAGAEVVVRASAADGQLRVEVRDRGAGMPAEVLARAGEPFFTTKPPGRGMGLGLFLSRAVVERLGGRLELAAAPGGGTLATLWLPPATTDRIAASAP